MKKMNRDRFRGCLLGLACGDAVGTTLEFKRPGSFAPITDMIGGGPFGLQPGQFTDDTSMALAMADSLIACRHLDPRDVMDRWVAWRKKGEYSCTGRCFDIGCTVAGALGRYLQTGNPYAGINRPDQAGNGCVMRLAPVAMMWATDHDVAAHAARLSCKLTHGADEAIELTAAFARTLVAALNGATKQQLLASVGRLREPPQLKSTGYVRDTLDVARWAFRHGRNFREAVLMAVNMGGDADTAGAVVGQLAGAFYGEAGIPKPWLQKLAWADRLRVAADRLYLLAAGEAGAA